MVSRCLSKQLVGRLARVVGRACIGAPFGRRHRLARALDQLPDHRRRIFLLHRVDKKSSRAIAARLGLSTDAVEAEIAAALLDLVSSLDA